MRAVHQRAQHTHIPRGDAGVIVAEYRFGNTVCKINDAFIVPEEEREQIDAEIATAAYACLSDESDDHRQ